MNENELYDSHMNKSEVFESASNSSINESEEDNNQVNDRYKAGEGFHAVPPPYTGNFMPLRPYLSFAGLDDSVFKSANGMMTQKLEDGFEFKKKACFICGSLNHLIKDCNFYENKMEGKYVLNNEGKATGQREVRPVWNNTQRVNHQNKLTHPHPRRNFVPSAVITNSRKVLVNTAKQSFPRAAVSNSTARYVNTVASRPTMNGAKPSSNVFLKSHSSVKRTFNQRAAPKNSDLKEKVNTAKVNNVTTIEPKAVVSAIQGHEGNPQHALKDQDIVDSGTLGI
ncbi:hypothetical protein Tco_0196793 [Tanacetum coccineum]